MPTNSSTAQATERPKERRVRACTHSLYVSNLYVQGPRVYHMTLSWSAVSSSKPGRQAVRQGGGREQENSSGERGVKAAAAAELSCTYMYTRTSSVLCMAATARGMASAWLGRREGEKSEERPQLGCACAHRRTYSMCTRQKQHPRTHDGGFYVLYTCKKSSVNSSCSLSIRTQTHTAQGQTTSTLVLVVRRRRRRREKEAFRGFVLEQKRSSSGGGGKRSGLRSLSVVRTKAFPLAVECVALCIPDRSERCLDRGPLPSSVHDDRRWIDAAGLASLPLCCPQHSHEQGQPAR